MNLLKKVRLTIGTKLVTLIALLLMVSAASLVWISTNMFIEDNTALIQQMNADTAASLATQTRELFENLTEKMRVMGTVLLQDFGSADARNQITTEFFSKDKEFLSVYLYKHNHDGTTSIQGKAVSVSSATFNDPSGERALQALATDRMFSMSQLVKGEVQISTLKLADGTPAIAIAVPFVQAASGGYFTHSLVSFVVQTKFIKVFSESDVITAFMVDRKGKLLAHPDASRVAAGENLAHLGIVKQLLEGKFNNGQTRYLDGEAKLGAYRVVGFGGLGIIAEVPEAKAFEASARVKMRAMLIAGIILSLSFFVGYFFSGTITWPIKQLVISAARIQEGDFNINLRPQGQDEVAHLSLAFNEMARGLEERDRVKDVFNKFHNKEIAEQLLSGAVNLGGERREAVIFFSDVRGFTGLSETMSPEQVVEMLNEYMTRMVAIIRAHKGIVDKYVGDAIMAVWGLPVASPDDTFNAVGACLAMREDLEKLNELRLSRGQPAIKIGMGLNRGPVIAGNIGSVEKMEYTVIGDAVNLASRIESMTKEYGADFLCSRSIHEQVNNDFIFEACKSAKVKGKSVAIDVFKIRGFYDEDRKPIIIETPYSSYAAEKSDKVVHDAEPALAAMSESAPEATQIFPSSTTNTDIRVAPDSPVANTTWYLSVDGEAYGPFSGEEIIVGIGTGEITAQMKASPSLEKPVWIPLADLPQFQDRFPKAA